MALAGVVRVVTHPWVIRWIDQPADTEDYKLPEYAELDEAIKGSEVSV
jgi:hypothetical protein